jgi:AraC-like DNA-binding protein
LIEITPARARARRLAAHGGDVRIGPLLGIPVVLRQFGFNPAPVVARAGLNLRLFDDPENRVSFAALGCLLEECVALTGCAHFGLLVGQQFDDRTLGTIGRLMQNCDTVEAALRRMVLHLHLNDSGAVAVLLRPSAAQVALGYSVFDSNLPVLAQLYDGALAVVWNAMRSLCGPAWRPVEVAFSHRRPADVTPHRRFFRARLRFDAPLSAVIFPARWLAHRIEGADPTAHAILSANVAQLEAQEAGRLTDQVRRALRPMVFAGTASATGVAEFFLLHERTLRRRLEAERTTVQKLIAEARFAVARQLVENTRMPLSDIAGVLHYSDATAFSRAFRTWASATPRAWRAHGPGGGRRRGRDSAKMVRR